MIRPHIQSLTNILKSSFIPNYRTMAKKNTAILFDVDGTLTKPMQIITEDFDKFLQEEIRSRASVCIVGGSDFSKISRQLGGQDCLNKYDYVFCENGLISYKDGKFVEKHSMVEFIGEELSQKFINFCLRYLSRITLPCKRGNFIEFRTGMLNVSPIGRSCSQEERDQFAAYDNEHGVRKKFAEAMRKEFPDSGLQFSLGGQISIDVFPVGWDKTYCLKNLMKDNNFKEIHFFGDKTMKGGNDYEIYEDSRTIGHSVTSPDDTKQQLMELFQLTK